MCDTHRVLCFSEIISYYNAIYATCSSGPTKAILKTDDGALRCCPTVFNLWKETHKTKQIIMKTMLFRTVMAAAMLVVGLSTQAQGDRAAFDLKGKVSSCVERLDNNPTSYNFNTAGRLTRYNGKTLAAAGFKVTKRDAKGRMTEFSIAETEFYVAYYTLKYDANGRVVVEKCSCDGDDSTTTYTYDAKGRLTKETTNGEYFEMGADVGEKYSTTVTYSYLATDAKGNWTKRRGTRHDGETFIETRTIKYYQ